MMSEVEREDRISTSLMKEAPSTSIVYGRELKHWTDAEIGSDAVAFRLPFLRMG